MHILFLTDNFPPEVNAPASRTFEHCRQWVKAGHRVTVITGGPGPRRAVQGEGFTVRYHRYLRHPVVMGRRPRLHYHLFALPCLASLLAGRYDLVHSLWYADAWAGTMARRIRGAPALMQLLTPPSPDFPVFREHPEEWRMLRAAVRRADRVLGISAYVTSCLREALGRDATVAMLPVDTSLFRPVAPRDSVEPQILYAGSLTDPRKNVGLLIRAFVRLLGREPRARLLLSGPVTPRGGKELLEAAPPQARGRIRVLGPGRRRDLPLLYSRAWVTVLPSRFEAQGLVLAESLACGTPVVGADAGAIPEVITDPAVGTLFPLGKGCGEEEVEALAAAVGRSLELAGDPATRGRCREHAMTFSWEVLGPRYEEVYQAILDGGGCTAAVTGAAEDTGSARACGRVSGQ